MALFSLLTDCLKYSNLKQYLNNTNNGNNGVGMKPEFSIEELEAVKRKYLKSCLKFRRRIRSLKKKLQNGDLKEDVRAEIAWELGQKMERLSIHGTVVQIFRKELKERRVR